MLFLPSEWQRNTLFFIGIKVSLRKKAPYRARGEYEPGESNTESLRLSLLKKQATTTNFYEKTLQQQLTARQLRHASDQA